MSWLPAQEIERMEGEDEEDTNSVKVVKGLAVLLDLVLGEAL